MENEQSLKKQLQMGMDPQTRELAIRSGLTHGVLIDGIQSMDEYHIVSEVLSTGTPFFLLVERMAQTGAFHIRHGIHFSMHIFLIGIRNLDIPISGVEAGIYRIKAGRQSMSERSYRYNISLENKDASLIVSGDFLFASTDYDTVFKSSILKPHYLKVAQCLKNDSRMS